MSFSYKAPDAPVTTRVVDPVKVHIADGQWYLQGWCHMRQAMRTFHLERVSDVALTAMPATHAADEAPELFEAFEAEAVVEARCRVDVVGMLGAYVEPGSVSGEGEYRTVRLRAGDERSLKRLAARHGGDVEILRPDAARRAAAQWAEAGLAHYA